MWSYEEDECVKYTGHSRYDKDAAEDPQKQTTLAICLQIA